MILRLLFLVLSKLRVAEIGIELIAVLTGFLLSGCVVSKDFLSSCDSKITENVMELVQESWKGRYDLENCIVSYFWVINESIGISDTREQMRVWSVTTTLSGFAALAMLLVMNHFLG